MRLLYLKKLQVKNECLYKYRNEKEKNDKHHFRRKICIKVFYYHTELLFNYDTLTVNIYTSMRSENDNDDNI